MFTNTPQPGSDCGNDAHFRASQLNDLAAVLSMYWMKNKRHEPNKTYKIYQNKWIEKKLTKIDLRLTGLLKVFLADCSQQKQIADQTSKSNRVSTRAKIQPRLVCQRWTYNVFVAEQP